MESNGFDFQKEWTVDFNIDFSEWPLLLEKEEEVRKQLPGCEFYDPDEEIEDSTGYVLIKYESKISYDYVIEKQNELTKKMKPLGGWCDSWGVMH